MIRIMTDADLPAVSVLETELFTSASWTISMLKQELHNPDRFYCVWTGELPTGAVPNPKISDPAHSGQVGPARSGPAQFCTDQTQKHDKLPVLGYGGVWTGGEDAEIMTLGVAKSAQRHGIGKLLLQCLIDTAREKKCRRVLLEVRVDNMPARSLYESVGFMPMGLRKHYYQPENVDALTMSLKL